MTPRLFCFGLGYTARYLVAAARGQDWRVAGTCRDEADVARLRNAGLEVFRFDRDHPLEPAALAGTTHLLSSVPPDAEGDPVLGGCAAELGRLTALAWAGYLSTTGVYGDTGGAVVDEAAWPAPNSQRSHRRLAAERRWLDSGLPVHVFRLAGIYGPGRSVFDQIREGRAKRIHRPGFAFSRIHVDDIVAVLLASMARPDPGAIYNVCDDAPAPQADVVAHACALLGMAPPPLVPYEEARATLSPMALTFWADNRRVDNGKIKRDLGVRLRYPDYHAGLAAVVAAEARGKQGGRS